MFLFLSHVYSSPVNISQIGFCVWSGKNCIESRILPNAQTFYQFLPEVTVYSEDFPKGSIEKIISQNNHVNIKFRHLNLQTFVLYGTEFDTPWNHAQSRILVSMHDFYTNNPDKDWYIFFDDDTYIFTETLLDFLEKKDPNEDAMYGVTYGVATYSSPFFKDPHKWHSFVHGGSSIIISKSFLKRVSQKLLQCNAIFDLANVGSDIRFAICLSRYFSDRNGDYEDYLKPDVYRFFPDTPENREDTRTKIYPQITYHHIVNERASRMFNSSIARLRTKEGEDVYMDFSIYSTLPYEFVLNDKRAHRFYFGYMLAHSDMTHGYARAISELKPNTNEGKPDFFIQEFERGGRVKYICDDELERGEITQEYHPPQNNLTLTVRIHCPELRHYANTFPGTTSPYNLSVVPIDQL
jgi:hypothetical protein